MGALALSVAEANGFHLVGLPPALKFSLIERSMWKPPARRETVRSFALSRMPRSAASATPAPSTLMWTENPLMRPLRVAGPTKGRLRPPDPGAVGLRFRGEPEYHY